MTDELRVVELFAGVGGFRLGLENASDKFKTIWANQWEPGKKNQFAFDCYNSHFGSSGSVNVNEDIETVKANVPDHDMLVGGFPCQDYSVAATKARGIEGKKGVLWWSIHDIVKNKKPNYVLLENVDRLLRSPVNQRGRDFGIILRCFADEGYDVEWRVINAAEYGLQQRRRRVFIFACKKGMKFSGTYAQEKDSIITKDGFFAKVFPVEERIPDKKVNNLQIGVDEYPTLVDISDDFAEMFYHAGFMTDYKVYTRDVIPIAPETTTNLRDILEESVDEKYYNVDVEKWQYLKGAKKLLRTRADGSQSLYCEGAIPFPDILDRPGRTMLTSEGTVNRSSHLILDPHTERYRTLTPVECERLNGFKDNWTNTGMTDRQRYFTMGNALVVQLIERMGKRILEIDN